MEPELTQEFSGDTVKPEWPDAHHKDIWSKCAFCGARNGQYGYKMEQHRPRCRFMGNADSLAEMHPNYQQMMDEDEQRVLDYIHTKDELAVCKRKLAALQAKQEKKEE